MPNAGPDGQKPDIQRVVLHGFFQGDVRLIHLILHSASVEDRIRNVMDRKDSSSRPYVSVGFS